MRNDLICEIRALSAEVSLLRKQMSSSDAHFMRTSDHLERATVEAPAQDIRSDKAISVGTLTVDIDMSSIDRAVERVQMLMTGVMALNDSLRTLGDAQRTSSKAASLEVRTSIFTPISGPSTTHFEVARLRDGSPAPATPVLKVSVPTELIPTEIQILSDLLLGIARRNLSD